MTFAVRSLPPEAEDPPPTRRDLLRMERDALLRQVRPRVRSLHQERIRRRIARLTLAILAEETSDEGLLLADWENRTRAVYPARRDRDR